MATVKYAEVEWVLGQIQADCPTAINFNVAVIWMQHVRNDINCVSRADNDQNESEGPVQFIVGAEQILDRAELL